MRTTILPEFNVVAEVKAILNANDQDAAVLSLAERISKLSPACKRAALTIWNCHPFASKLKPEQRRELLGLGANND